MLLRFITDFSYHGRTPHIQPSQVRALIETLNNISIMCYFIYKESYGYGNSFIEVYPVYIHDT